MGHACEDYQLSNDVTTQERELSRLKLVELKAMATELGLKGVSAMRKPQLIEAISTAQSNSSPEASAPRRRRAEREEASEAPQVSIELPEASVQESASEERSSREASLPRKSRRRRVVSSEAAEPPTVTLDLPAPAQREEEESAPSQHIEISLPDSDDPESRERSRRDREGRRRGRGREGRESRRERGDRGERGERREAAAQASASEENLAPIAGILDVQENHAFVRTSGYLPGPNDVYVTLGNVRRWGLRPGDAVAGAVRQPREGERQRQKYNALVRVDSVNGMSIEDAQARREFSKLTPIYPDQQLRMETSAKAYTPRVIDLVAPIGKGQRGLIVSPPKAGKTMVIQQIAKAIELNNPEVHLMVVLVDERPEEVTDMRSIVKGEVIASTFDRPASDHAIVAELAIERAKRLVELGQDVVVLLDSITRLSRAYNLAAPASGRILSGGVDASALYPPKKFFGGARNLREGGSLTIIASALVETGSKMDEVIFEEFKGTGNMELRLSRQLADRRIFPAIDINASGTRREEMLLKPEELRIMWKLRRVLGTLDQQSALEAVLDRLKETQSNAEFLMLVQKQVPSAD
ncbi:MAG: transcription termination factor Rho [Actinomyces sp.]|nr:transcription termination factor Rho [Actinomyces sp.]